MQLRQFKSYKRSEAPIINHNYDFFAEAKALQRNKLVTKSSRKHEPQNQTYKNFKYNVHEYGKHFQASKNKPAVGSLRKASHMTD